MADSVKKADISGQISSAGGLRSLFLMVRSRNQVLFSGKVTSLSSFNEMGKFDVLKKHANFISLINKSLQIRLEDGSEKEIKVDHGVMRVLKNKVDVYLGIRGRA